MAKNIFERATRKKLRFVSARGALTTEDLWDLNLTDLNLIAKGLNKELKAAEEEDFLAEGADIEDATAKLSFDVVIHVLNTKKKEKEYRENAVAKKAEKDKLLALLDKKEDESLGDLSAEEIRERIAALD